MEISTGGGDTIVAEVEFRVVKMALRGCGGVGRDLTGVKKGRRWQGEGVFSDGFTGVFF